MLQIVAAAFVSGNCPLRPKHPRPQCKRGPFDALILAGVVTSPITIEPQMPFFSLTSLAIGVAHLAGAVGLLRAGRSPDVRVSDALTRSPGLKE